MKVYSDKGTVGALKDEPCCRETAGGTIDAVATVTPSDLHVFQIKQKGLKLKTKSLVANQRLVLQSMQFDLAAVRQFLAGQGIGGE